MAAKVGSSRETSSVRTPIASAPVAKEIAVAANGLPSPRASCALIAACTGSTIAAHRASSGKIRVDAFMDGLRAIADSWSAVGGCGSAGRSRRCGQRETRRESPAACVLLPGLGQCPDPAWRPRPRASGRGSGLYFSVFALSVTAAVQAPVGRLGDHRVGAARQQRLHGALVVRRVERAVRAGGQLGDLAHHALLVLLGLRAGLVVLEHDLRRLVRVRRGLVPALHRGLARSGPSCRRRPGPSACPPAHKARPPASRRPGPHT